MDGQSYGIQWMQHHIPDDMKASRQFFVDAQSPQADEMLENCVASDGADYLVDEDGSLSPEDDLDQMAAQNLIFMAQDGQMVTEIITATGTDDNGAVIVSASDGTNIDCEAVMQQVAVMSGVNVVHHQQDAGGGGYTEEYIDTTPQMVTEEVITDDWVQHQGEERVEITAEQIIGSSSQVLLDIEVPLPTVQDEYTALRPYPCDFCSRRFRKKASLMNHMVAHQNDRPHLCKLCGSRFFRRSDLINHLKAHAEAPDPEFDDADFINFGEPEQSQQRQSSDHYYDQDWNVQPELIALPKKNRHKSNTVSGNSASTSSSAVVGRGRISRLKPKKGNFSSHSTVQHRNGLTNSVDLKYDNCQELQNNAAIETLNENQLSAEQKSFPIIDDNKPFVCQQCGLAFAREKALLSHSKTHRNNSPYECNQCSEMFWDTLSLQDHQKSHQFEESNSEYDPDEAGDSQTETDSERLYGEFYCSECGMSFHRQDLLRRHMKKHMKNDPESDDEKDRHCCNTCGESFDEALDLLAHAEIHARCPPFKCVLCGESFFEEHTIKRHLQTQHANEITPNSCILCGKECRDRKALIKHAWEHSREKCHSCSKCGKNFHNKARLKRHMASHRDKSVVCDVCQEEFPDGRSLSNHRHSHSTSATGKLFPCHECGKTFGSRSSQQIHVRIHTGERPYGCRFCWKAFADGGTLRKHERIHTGEKPYACSVCPRAFNQRVVLREHIRSHHSGLDVKRGTYYCTVCTAELPSSNELIQHLIHHSDANTAMQRQPVNGPRKYKRRRKLKPHELERLRNENKHNGNCSDVDITDVDVDSVDDLLAITEAPKKAIAKSRSTKTTKRNKQALGTNLKRNNSNNTTTAANGSYTSITEEESVDERQKNRYNSSSSNSDKSWQAKFMNSNLNDSLLSNLENTLQTIEPLVVSSNSEPVGDRAQHSNQKYNAKNARNSTAQRTQAVQITKTAGGSTKSRKRQLKSTKTRPRMIHTEKWYITNTDGSKQHLITRTAGANMQLLPKPSTIVDDYEIISPATHLPSQISSSPLHIKQEQDSQHHQHMSQSSRSNDLYNAQLLLEASTLRKETFEKYNPSIVNDLEEILRSPIKSDKSGRCRYTSESSTQFLGEQSEEEQHLIKIEPTSPDLRDIVTSSSHSIGNSGCLESRLTRSTRNHLVTASPKYLVFDNDTASMSTSNCVIQKSLTPNVSKDKGTMNLRKGTSAIEKSYLGYSVDTFNSDNCTSSNTTVSSSFSSISAVVSAADASAAAAAAAATVPPDRKKRYFECEMCSAIFPDRAQLLDHVPIHI